MNGEIANFELSTFNEFVSSYQITTLLASEVLDAFNEFLLALNRFFDI